MEGRYSQNRTGSYNLSNVADARAPRPPVAHPKSDGLEAFDHKRFGKTRAGPFLECRQRHHRIEIMPRLAAHLDRIGAKTMHHRRKHGVRAAERAEQERSLLAITAIAIGPDLLNARHIGACVIRQIDRADRAM